MMKTLLCLLSITATAFAGEVIQTQARLPDDQLLTAVPEKATGIEVTAELKSDEAVFSAVQGNWVRIERRLTYAVTSPAKDFPLTEFSFICLDSNVVAEAGIHITKTNWPFRKGRMKFTLERDATVRHTPYFKILRYEPVPETK